MFITKEKAALFGSYAVSTGKALSYRLVYRSRAIGGSYEQGWVVVFN